MSLNLDQWENVSKGDRNSNRHVITSLGIVSVDSLARWRMSAYDSRRISSSWSAHRNFPEHLAKGDRIGILVQRTFIFHHDPIQAIAHIGPHVAVPILVHGQAAARVLQEQM